MANKFKPNRKGYLEALNNDDAWYNCDKVGGKICSDVNAAGSGAYTYDTIYGKTRVHTRVKTFDRKAYYQERHNKTLARFAERHK